MKVLQALRAGDFFLADVATRFGKTTLLREYIVWLLQKNEPVEIMVIINGRLALERFMKLIARQFRDLLHYNNETIVLPGFRRLRGFPASYPGFNRMGLEPPNYVLFDNFPARDCASKVGIFFENYVVNILSHIVLVVIGTSDARRDAPEHYLNIVSEAFPHTHPLDILRALGVSARERVEERPEKCHQSWRLSL